ncbi:hypothetical protein N7495_009735 [Penicillium taxi]|uniref:uncharacterized protein n=1 Tax=Penicillium taxi TaxID=168475 RepID=UPI00254506D8|nr:uncharacterized protein N7495_009735 [Penicillium taxi]KAJ5885225.1 hypothetical protein N7495_009735 [Penicillium taxi]
MEPNINPPDDSGLGAGSEEEFEDARRVELINMIAAKLENPEVSTSFWAGCWLSDIQALERIHATEELLMTIPNARQLYESATDRSVRNGVLSCEAQPKKNLPEDQNLPCQQRCSEAASACCMKRDQEICAITGNDIRPDIAHIYPYSLNEKRTSRHRGFWALLKTFWNPETIRRWEGDILEPSGTEQCCNLLALSSDVHRYWGATLFALKPLDLSQDGTIIRLQFYWIKIQKNPQAKTTLSSRPSLAINGDSPGPGLCIYSGNLGRPLMSRDVITMTTADADAYPLPSIAILELQWKLHRMAALCAGAGDESDDNDDSDDGNNSDDDDEDLYPVELEQEAEPSLDARSPRHKARELLPLTTQSGDVPRDEGEEDDEYDWIDVIGGRSYV